MFFELLNVETGNLIGTYESEADALAVVRRAAHFNGAASVDALALGYEDDDGEGAQLAAGPELLARALASYPDRLSRPA